MYDLMVYRLCADFNLSFLSLIHSRSSKHGLQIKHFCQQMKIFECELKRVELLHMYDDMRIRTQLGTSKSNGKETTK